MSLMAASKQLMGHQFSTYRIGGPLEEAYQPASLEETMAVLNVVVKDKKKLTVLGWGGNSLIASAGISGVTLITRKMGWVNPINSTTIEFGAGVHLAKVSATALTHSLCGAEFMIGIPGTVGGAIRMNAGALKQEMRSVVQSVQVYCLTSGEIKNWSPEELGFAYRSSRIDPQKSIVLSAVLSFKPGEAASIKTLMQGSVSFRKSHHPTEPNGGSVFQNPLPDKPAGLLLDQLNAKTWTEGGVRISPLHANFIVNLGAGTSLDVLQLMLRMKRAIEEHYQLDTHPENKFLGDGTEQEYAIWKELTGEEFDP